MGTWPPQRRCWHDRRENMEENFAHLSQVFLGHVAQYQQTRITSLLVGGCTPYRVKENVSKVYDKVLNDNTAWQIVQNSCKIFPGVVQSRGSGCGVQGGFVVLCGNPCPRYLVGNDTVLGLWTDHLRHQGLKSVGGPHVRVNRRQRFLVRQVLRKVARRRGGNTLHAEISDGRN